MALKSYNPVTPSQRQLVLVDRAGLLVDAGYQCCDAWQLQDSHLTSPHDFALLALSAATIGAT